MLSKKVCLFKYPISPQEGSSGIFFLLSWSTNLIPVDWTCVYIYMYIIYICIYIYMYICIIYNKYRNSALMEEGYHFRTLAPDRVSDFFLLFRPPVIHCSWSSNACSCESALDPFFIHICWWAQKGTDLDLPKAEFEKQLLIHNLEHVEIYWCCPPSLSETAL